MRAPSPPHRSPVEPPVPPQESGLPAQLGRIVDGFSRLLAQHVELARMELADEARAVGASAARIAAFIPFILTGYLLLCVALSLILERLLGTGAGFAIVGGINLLGGGVGVWAAVRSMQRRPAMLAATRDELRASALAIKSNPSVELSDGV